MEFICIALFQISPDFPPMTVDDGSRALIPYEDYSKVFDRCSAERFDNYRRRFRTIHLSLLTLNLFLTTIATLLQAWDTGDADQGTAVEWHDMITLIAGGTAVLVRGAEQTLGLVKAEAECSAAHSDLSYFLATRRPMPAYIHMRILQTNTLCFRLPRKCRREAVDNSV